MQYYETYQTNNVTTCWHDNMSAVWYLANIYVHADMFLVTCSLWHVYGDMFIRTCSLNQICSSYHVHGDKFIAACSCRHVYGDILMVT